MNRRLFHIFQILIWFSAGLHHSSGVPQETKTEATPHMIIYQVFTRLFGNKQESFVPWGTIEQNGVGKFEDFTDAALNGIRELGVTHIWYTGVLHHAVIRDYTAFGISNDDPDVVKGRAGSPYAVKDYFQVDPDLAIDPSHRLEEFESLIERTHQHGMKVMIDIVPNHLARGYEGLNNPEGVVDFGANDDTSVEYSRDNNFYYISGSSFQVPDLPREIAPLGGEKHPLSDGKFVEIPAKWTGNGSRKAKPDANDWYETVKVNYGVRPDGTHDFPELPAGYELKTASEHYEFWNGKDVPDSWKKFRSVAEFWLSKGVDGFRFDMAEMVPVEFWSYLNSSIKYLNPDAVLLAEVYQPQLYRDYIFKGKMDYLYDKVDLYDTLKAILAGNESPAKIAEVQNRVLDIENHMLHFLENHDEQRLASPAFAGDPFRAFPLLVVSATLGTSPTMLYFSQDVGEDGSEDAGFGKPTRTSIFDYIGVPAHQRWMNGGAFDGGKLTETEKQLRSDYIRLFRLIRDNPAFSGSYAEIHQYNLEKNPQYRGDCVFAYIRNNDEQQVLVVVNFSDHESFDIPVMIPESFIASGHHSAPKDLWTHNPVCENGIPESVSIQLHISASGFAIIQF